MRRIARRFGIISNILHSRKASKFSHEAFQRRRSEHRSKASACSYGYSAYYQTRIKDPPTQLMDTNLQDIYHMLDKLIYFSSMYFNAFIKRHFLSTWCTYKYKIKLRNGYLVYCSDYVNFYKHCFFFSTKMKQFLLYSPLSLLLRDIFRVL